MTVKALPWEEVLLFRQSWQCLKDRYRAAVLTVWQWQVHSKKWWYPNAGAGVGQRQMQNPPKLLRPGHHQQQLGDASSMSLTVRRFSNPYRLNVPKIDFTKVLTTPRPDNSVPKLSKWLNKSLVNFFLQTRQPKVYTKGTFGEYLI